ncbi:hypothetical protein MUO79_01155 [Candidatus Bathyarchaeota archaeon]|nr:hypothetical protein [Candidatus Bathyarchaeota archaeon]
MSESIQALITLVPSCPIFDHIHIQHSKSIEMLKLARFRRKKAKQTHELCLSVGGEYQDAMMIEFKDFLISAKTALDSLAHEVCLIFSLQIPARKISFNLFGFVTELEAKDQGFAVGIKGFCENGDWFRYFVDLRNPQTHRGLVEVRPYLIVKPTRDMEIRAVFRKKSEEVRDISDREMRSISHRQKDPAIQEVGFLLPDNPEETDPKKLVYEKKIVLEKHIDELYTNIDSLFLICYKEAIEEMTLLKKGILDGHCCYKVCRNNCIVK